MGVLFTAPASLEAPVRTLQVFPTGAVRRSISLALIPKAFLYDSTAQIDRSRTSGSVCGIEAKGSEVIVKRDADEQGVPPGRHGLASPYDADARWPAESDQLFWRGYEIHLTESCHAPAEGRAGDAATVNLITDVATTDATVPDVKATAGIQQRLAEAGLAPSEHYLDSGCLSVDLVTAAAKKGTEMVTPLLADHSPQAKADQGFAKSAFRIPMTQDPDGLNPDGGPPVAASTACEGAVQ